MAKINEFDFLTIRIANSAYTIFFIIEPFRTTMMTCMTLVIANNAGPNKVAKI